MSTSASPKCMGSSIRSVSSGVYPGSVEALIVKTRPHADDDPVREVRFRVRIVKRVTEVNFAKTPIGSPNECQA